MPDDGEREQVRHIREVTRKKFVKAVDMDVLGERVKALRKEFERRMENVELLVAEIEGKDEDFRARWIALVEGIHDFLRGTLTREDPIYRVNETTGGMDKELPDGLTDWWTE